MPLYSEIFSKNVPLHFSTCEQPMFPPTRARMKNSGLTNSIITSQINFVAAVSVPNSGHLMALTDLCW